MNALSNATAGHASPAARLRLNPVIVVTRRKKFFVVQLKLLVITHAARSWSVESTNVKSSATPGNVNHVQETRVECTFVPLDTTKSKNLSGANEKVAVNRYLFVRVYVKNFFLVDATNVLKPVMKALANVVTNWFKKSVLAPKPQQSILAIK